MERFWSKTAPDGGCVVWTAGTRRDGYGVFSLGGRMRAAHRVAWELTHGDIPEEGSGHHGCVVHTCDNRLCVNPEHLRLGTQKENMHDAIEKGRFAFNRPQGEKHHATPLTVKDVQTIRVAAAEGTSQAALARRYGVSPPALSKIVRRLTWRHVA